MVPSTTTLALSESSAPVQQSLSRACVALSCRCLIGRDEHNVLNLTVPEPDSWGDGSVTTISPLRAGQASLHSDLLLHSSDANSSSRRSGFFG